MAVGDGSPTSGGSGDVLVTEDTFTDTGTGTSGQKLAAGKLYTGSQGVSLGPVISIRNDLPTNDFKSQSLLGTLVELMTDMLDGIQSLLGNQVFAERRAVQADAVTTTTVKGNVASQTLLGMNAARIGCAFYNDSTSTGNLYLLFGQPGAKATSAAGGCTVRIVPGGYYEMPANSVHIGFVYGLWDSVTVPGWVNITEFSS